MQILTEIEQVFFKHRHIPYLGEVVTQLEHALQAAREAEKAHAPEVMITAALLHDIGHMVHNLPPEDINYVGFWNQDDGHEVVAEKWLARAFPDEVIQPIRWHVAAKRYLAATEPGYENQLTAASVHVLQLQGGPMNQAELQQFEASPWVQPAIAVRRWDDRAKTPGRTTPTLEHYLEIAQRCLKTPAR